MATVTNTNRQTVWRKAGWAVGMLDDTGYLVPCGDEPDEASAIATADRWQAMNDSYGAPARHTYVAYQWSETTIRTVTHVARHSE